ncbi:MAG: ACR3 family arsenite efflux transporter [Proteobacteria bacterium]|nr:ACR3 family arsenite efflux transporter [Pseudomonadota bacterium]
MNLFEKYLSIWVAACILIGISLGQLFPQTAHFLGGLNLAQVNLPVGILIWIMIIPMLVKIDFSALHQLKRQWKGISVTLFINWMIKPFLMAFLGWLFIRHLFTSWLPASQIDSYIAGLILLAAAPCTAMVFVWSRLTQGDPLFTLSQVALNDTIMIVAYAPIVALLLGFSSIPVPWATLLVSVTLYIILPVLISRPLRLYMTTRGTSYFDQVRHQMAFMSMGALLCTLILLFSFQGTTIVKQPAIIALLAIPIILNVIINSTLAYWLNLKLRVDHSIACPSTLIGASNFFELAVATAISLYGFQSGAALATVVGVLVEVPVMLIVVRAVNSSRNWYTCHQNPALKTGHPDPVNTSR